MKRLRPEKHVLLAGALGGVGFLSTRSTSVAVATFLAGVVVDGDHLVDYAIYWKSKGGRPPLKELINGSMFRQWGKFGICLHSYELLLPLWALALISDSITLVSWVSFSFVVHLISDQISYPLHPLIYFFTFRLNKRFEFASLVASQGVTKEHAGEL